MGTFVYPRRDPKFTHDSVFTKFFPIMNSKVGGIIKFFSEVKNNFLV